METGLQVTKMLMINLEYLFLHKWIIFIHKDMILKLPFKNDLYPGALFTANKLNKLFSGIRQG